MAIIKCKMCGGDIELAADKTFGTCEFCGSTMTLPKVDDDQRAAAFNRGNHFRRIGEFDKALAVYERIVREDDTDAEAHWCCALCRFGIEYVEDPATYEYLPTCHRASFDSFLEDVDYLAAVEHSEGITKRQYQKDAAKIAEVQRGILATSQNEEPFDVFICYKESDENGQRTRDSLMAQDVYYQLTDQGYRVFFARITLEDMAGKQYEPYIFAALNSAKVMIVIGTKPEYMNAVWVKNEWSRFLAMMKKDRHKILLPCYKDMDPYDMPEQLSVLQSYDMSKIGFIQDLIRGIKKVLEAEKKPEIIQETVITGGNTNTAPLLKRAFMFLEDGDWNSANEYCEKVLDIDPECAEAYLGKLMAELQVKTQDSLKDQAEPYDGSHNYQKAVRFADDALKTTLADMLITIKNRILEGEYNKAASILEQAITEEQFKTAVSILQGLGEYKDSIALMDEHEKRWASRQENANKIWADYLEINVKLVALTSEIEKKAAVVAQLKNDLAKAQKLLQEGLKQSANLASYDEQYQANQLQIAQATKEQASLGLFAFSQKREISAKITSLTAISTRLEKEIASARNFIKTNGTVESIRNTAETAEQKHEALSAELTALNNNLVLLRAQIEPIVAQLENKQIISILAQDEAIFPLLIKEAAVVSVIKSDSELQKMIKSLAQARWQEVIMPKAGVTVESCIIGEFFKNVGDFVKVGDILFTYETEKASFECESTATGKLVQILYEEGDNVPCLNPVCYIDPQ